MGARCQCRILTEADLKSIHASLTEMLNAMRHREALLAAQGQSASQAMLDRARQLASLEMKLRRITGSRALNL